LQTQAINGKVSEEINSSSLTPVQWREGDEERSPSVDHGKQRQSPAESTQVTAKVVQEPRALRPNAPFRYFDILRRRTR
jgi:hypothetical protein